MRSLLPTLATLFISFCLLPRAHAQPIQLAADGKALQPIIITDETLRPVAAELAEMLQRITDARFDIQVRSNSIVTSHKEGVVLAIDPVSEPVPITQREHYFIRSKAECLLLGGNTVQAVEHAVWDVLHRIGFRHFLPGKTWEIVPHQRDLSLTVNASESPDYHTRRIWAGFGYMKERAPVVEEWNRRNRATSGIELHTGHAYDHIMDRHKADFAAHPEYLALVKGQRQPPKFCIANPGLRKLVADDALAQLRKDPTLDSVSCDPSDGGGWCECADCAKVGSGSVTDRALTLANEVAAAVEKEFPGRFVGMYAYNEHSPPPTLQAHPQVVISVATSFIRGGFTVDELIAGWSARARTLGIREYYSVNTWDRDLPGAARGGDLGYLSRTIPDFYHKGARFMSAEASDNAGPNGLGSYVAARMMWDVGEAARVDLLIADFLEKCFGSARAPMAVFYQLMDGARRQPLSDDLVGRMFRHLDAAWRATTDPAVHARLADLILYTHYAGLFLDYSSATGAARQTAFEALFRHIWRMRDTGMIHTKGLWRDLPNRDKTVKIPELARYSAPDATNPWRTDPPYTAAQVAEILRQGIESRRLLDFTPVSFSLKLVPATPLKLKASAPGNAGIYQRGVRDYWTWITDTPAKIQLTGSAGIIYANRGPAKIALYPLAEAESKAVASAEVSPDKAKHDISLDTSFPGLHRIEISDGGQGTLIGWPAGAPMTFISSPEQPASLHGRWHMHFYVPKGTPVIGGFSTGEGYLCDPSGKTVHTFPARPGFFSIPVPAGMDGQLWSFKHSSGSRHLMTVPPCLARDATELLLPEEIVQRDAVPNHK